MEFNEKYYFGHAHQLISDVTFVSSCRNVFVDIDLQKIQNVIHKVNQLITAKMLLTACFLERVTSKVLGTVVFHRLNVLL